MGSEGERAFRAPPSVIPGGAGQSPAESRDLPTARERAGALAENAEDATKRTLVAFLAIFARGAPFPDMRHAFRSPEFSGHPGAGGGDPSTRPLRSPGRDDGGWGWLVFPGLDGRAVTVTVTVSVSVTW